MNAGGKRSKGVTLGYLVSLVCQLCILLLCSMGLVRCDSLVVDTDKGKVRGFSENVDGKQVDIFYGIPYASPPVKELRFLPPTQKEPWPDVRDATQLPNSCYQGYDNYFGNFSGTNMWNPNTKISEDCLYLNVWTPRVNPPFEGKSVIVWIYGGCFNTGSSSLDIYQASYLAAENDVVVVSMQYRIGALGFLALNSAEAPGNAGIWDQRMALEWIVKNIQNFGGNPQSITLMGESAGSGSVGVFLLCDSCSHLFHKAILQSGAPQANWGIRKKEVIVKRSEKFARSLGCDKQTDHDYIVKCLRDIEYTPDVLALEGDIAKGIMQPPFVPVVDGILINEDASQLIEAGKFRKIPILLGSDENEGSYFIVYYFQDYNLEDEPQINISKYTSLMKNDFFRYGPYYPLLLNEATQEAIMFHYKDWINPDNPMSLSSSMDQAVGDAYFVCPVNELARAYSKNGLPVYYYWFSQRWSANPWPSWMGVLHGDEIWFTFGHPLNRSYSFTDGERDLSRKMMAYWTNFAKTGDPNKNSGKEVLPEWPLFKHNEQKYLNLSVASFASNQPWGQGPRTQHCAFWDEYLPKLLAETSNVKDLEKEWMRQFEEWKKHYIIDWRTQFDNFINNYQSKMSTCERYGP